MPSRSVHARRKSNKQTKKLKHLTTTPNHHSSPAVQFQGKSDLKLLREEIGRSGNGSLRPINEKLVHLVVEEEKGKKKGFSLSGGAAVSTGHNKMERTLEETQKLESQSEDKVVIVHEEIKSVVDFGGEVAAETQDGDDSNFVKSTISDEQATQNEEKSELVDSGQVEETKEVSEAVVEFIASDEVGSKLKENLEKDLLAPEETDLISQDVVIEEVEVLEETELLPSEENNELSSALANENLRETEAVETIQDLTGADENKLASSEEKNEVFSGVTSEVLRESGETMPPFADGSDKVPPTIADSLPKGIEESKFPATDEKVGESSVFQESSKEDAKESLPPVVNVAATETTSATAEDKTETLRSTENPQHTSWRSCCGLFELLGHGDR